MQQVSPHQLHPLHDLLYTAQRTSGDAQTQAINDARLLLSRLLAAKPQAEIATGPCGQCKDDRTPCACAISTMLKERGQVAVDATHYANMSARAKAAVQPVVPGIDALEAEAEHHALRDVYEMARGVLRHDGIDMERALKYKEGLIEAIETVKTIDGGNWEPAHPAEAVQPAVPMFWVRLCRGGLYEGPVHNNSDSGKLLREEKPGEWHPLYLHAAPAHPAEGVPAPDENAAFEAWARGQFFVPEKTLPTSQGYNNSSVQDMWEAWKARAALAATQPAAQGSAYAAKGTKEVFCKKCEMTVISNCGSASGCPVRNIYAAQAKQGGV